ncbi:hypothetical protein [Kaistella jeonii]|uniref:GTP-binding protein n=1 Tax=Kaistella jeonii TaxID=266749 RepID=A0A0C1CYZ9_9FLAO|nr:hypothetical protein [Kaistella jeonii]KIA89626.1 hypothetical protein OA86_03070 [Kaistella jeonii]SFB89644.1 hypothetical protein SAMN05421876_103285 [Kaistella jeonii]VEI95841.1 Uncharacterized protein conserved in bacteria [Kaistella jeonii]
MTIQKPFRKFIPQQKKIEELEKNSPRFKRIYEEYELMSDELYNMENSDTSNIPDDFMDAVKIQTEYLEDEIGDWLLEKSNKES